MIGAILRKSTQTAPFPPEAPRTPDDPRAEIAARFPEGFDTAALQEGTALREALGVNLEVREAAQGELDGLTGKQTEANVRRFRDERHAELSGPVARLVQ